MTDAYRSNFKAENKLYTATRDDMRNDCYNFRPWFTRHRWQKWDSDIDNEEYRIIPENTWFCSVRTVKHVYEYECDVKLQYYGHGASDCETNCYNLVMTDNFIGRCSCDHDGSMYVDSLRKS